MMPRADSAEAADAFAIGDWDGRAADRKNALADSPMAMQARLDTAVAACTI
jgi:hypothetical protein